MRNRSHIHVIAVHEKNKLYECSVCDFKCTYRGNLNQHIKSVHEKKKSQECLICDFACTEKSQ